MNRGPLIFLAAFFALASSWVGLVLTPQIQLGGLQQTNTVPAKVAYPVARAGLAQQGREVYRANGCACCHSQQLGQTGTVFDVTLNEAGTNQAATLLALLKLMPGSSEADARQVIVSLPRPVLRGVTKEAADAATKVLNATSARAQTWTIPIGPDIARGWGKRRTVAEDFLFDYPVMLGAQRVGPDLADLGARQPDSNWQLRHLYAPRIEVKASTMPPYRFLFEKRKINRARSPEALALPPKQAPESGYEIVPRPEAVALVAYLISLRADAPLFVVPFTAAPGTGSAAATNAPVAGGPASTNTPVANTPAK